MTVWVTRNTPIVSTEHVAIWTEKPKREYGVFSGNKQLVYLKIDAFRKMFGFTPRKGSCNRYNIAMTRKPEGE